MNYMDVWKTMLNWWQWWMNDNQGHMNELQDKCMTTIWWVNDNGKWITMINELQDELMTTMNEW